MSPDPDITTVAELEPFGLSTSSLEILDVLGFVSIDDLTELTAQDIQDHEGGGPVTIKNIRETLRNYQNNKPVRTEHDMLFPKHWPKKKRRR